MMDNNTPRHEVDAAIAECKRSREQHVKLHARKLIQEMADIDFMNGDSLYLKFGGEGDNGEYLIELLEQALTEGEY